MPGLIAAIAANISNRKYKEEASFHADLEKLTQSVRRQMASDILVVVNEEIKDLQSDLTAMMDVSEAQIENRECLKVQLKKDTASKAIGNARYRLNKKLSELVNSN